MRSLRLVIALLLALEGWGGLTSPASAQVWLWSQTPTSNGNIDPSINWQEGMPPSAVDDSARATMSGVALWRDDSNGLVTLGGTNVAYTATTNQGNHSGGVSSLTPGFRLCFSPNVVNSTPVTLQVDAQAAKPLRRAPNTALVGGELVVGTPYCATYFSSNGGEYIVNDYFTVTAMISNGSIVYAKIQNESASTILGNPTGAPAAPSEITLGAGLSFSGTSVIIPTNGIVTGMITGSNVTYAKIQNETNATILGNNSGASAAPSENTLGAGLSWLSSTSFGVGTGALTSGMYAASSITYAKIQNETASTLLGNPTGSAAAPSEITLGSSMSFSGTTVNSKVVDSTTVYSGGTSTNCLINNSGLIATSPNCALLNVQDQTLSGGANVTSFSLGTFSSGTLTVDCGKSPLQFATNGGAFTIAAPANDGACDIMFTNNATAGAITQSGFATLTNFGEGGSLTNGQKYVFHVERINGTAWIIIKNLF